MNIVIINPIAATTALVSRRGGLAELVSGGAGIAFEPTEADIRSPLEQFEAEEMSLMLRQRARFTYETRHHPVRYLERYMILIEEEGEEAIEKMNDGTLTAGNLDSTAH